MNIDGLLITIVDECLQKARKMHIETMEEFSIWLLANNWEFNYTTQIWENYENPFQHSFSDVYELFLKSKEA